FSPNFSDLVALIFLRDMSGCLQISAQEGSTSKARRRKMVTFTYYPIYFKNGVIGERHHFSSSEPLFCHGDECFNLVRTGQTNQSIRFPAIFEKDQRRNPSQVEAWRCRGILIHVDLVDLRSSSKFFGGCFNCGCHCAAWPAPGCPEIHKDWLLRLKQFIFKTS